MKCTLISQDGLIFLAFFCSFILVLSLISSHRLIVKNFKPDFWFSYFQDREICPLSRKLVDAQTDHLIYIYI
jgi:hypothetical protein